MAMPANKRQLQSFLGAVDYYRMFIPKFSELAEPLYQLLRKNAKFVWSTEQTKAVEDLKNKLSSAPIVKFPNYDLPFVIYTDAFNVGLDAILMQPDGDVLHPIAYAFKSLEKVQRNYSTTKKEALALLFSVEQFRHMILCHETHVYTDHKPLHGALQRPTKDQCLQRWAALLQEYDVTFRYVEGKNNAFADILSRIPIEINIDKKDLDVQFQEDLLERNNVFCLNLQSFIPVKVDWSNQELIKAQGKDTVCQIITEQFKIITVN